MLTAAQAKIADSAIAKVSAAASDLRSAVEGESLFLTWVTGSESAASARRNALATTDKVEKQLRDQRKTLTPERLLAFVELAATAADVSSIVADARRMTAAGFKAEVIDPTLAAANPLNLSGPVGKAVLFAGLALLAVYLLSRKA